MRHRLVVPMVCLMLFASRVALALEVGVMEALSLRYQPLDARIALSDVQAGDLEGMRVTLGSPAQFELAGLARPNYLKLLEFDVVEQDDGRSHIRVSTKEPIIEPSLSFLVNVEWPRGRIVRGYNLRLTAAAAGGRSDSAAVSPALTEAPQPPEAAKSASDPASDSASEPQPSIRPAGAAAYGPVRRAETLWSIASRLRPDRSISVQRMMLAILEANPEAFVNGNINALRAGALLHIPSRDEIGRGEHAEVVEEVRRQHSEWKKDRAGERAAPPVAPVSPREPAPAVPETQPTGRIEIVSPETLPGVAERGEAVVIQKLRDELALAVEDADARRRENADLMLRLSEAEEHITELNRLVDLKNDEIAALQAELRAAAEAAATPAPEVVAEEEARPVTPAVEEEAKPDMPAVEEEARPVTPAMEEEAKPDMPAEEEEAKPIMPEPDEEPEPVTAEPAEAPEPVLAELETEPAPPEPKGLPFGLDALPVNPMYLVGGAGVLLILLGVAVLIRRRRAAGDESGEIELADTIPESEDNLLEELEAVAADLSDEGTDASRRRAVAGGSAAALAMEAAERDPPQADADTLTAEQIAELWKDEFDSDRGRSADTKDGSDVDVDEITFDIDTLPSDEPALEVLDEEPDDDFDINDLVDLADLAEERESSRKGLDDEEAGELSLLFDDKDEPSVDLSLASSELDETDADPFLPATDADGEVPRRPFGDGLGMEDAADSGSPAAESAEVDADWAVSGDAGGIADLQLEPDEESRDLADPKGELLGDATDEEAGAFSLDGYGEDDVQTKIDLAQVYLEMDDTERARALLETVLAEGDADQQDTARAMLSKMT